MRFLDHRFALTANGTTVRTETVAGVTTFLTMAYIIFVQPTVLSAAGMDVGAVLAATCLATALGTSTVRAYIESGAGVAAGGRTGLASLVTAALFLSLFFYRRHDDGRRLAPCGVGELIIMPLTVSITEGVAVDLLSYALLKLASGHSRAVHPLIYVFAVLFLGRYMFLIR